MTTAAWIAGSVASTGGLAAVAVKLGLKSAANQRSARARAEEEHDPEPSDG